MFAGRNIATIRKNVFQSRSHWMRTQDFMMSELRPQMSKMKLWVTILHQQPIEHFLQIAISKKFAAFLLVHIDCALTIQKYKNRLVEYMMDHLAKTNKYQLMR